jgi:hypothetical protein
MSQASEMASTGQTPAQAPQFWHFAGSIQRRSSFSEMASTGHSLSQEPQFTQASPTLYAIIYLSLGFITSKHTAWRLEWQGPFKQGAEIPG